MEDYTYALSYFGLSYLDGFSSLFGILSYVFMGIGLMEIAKGRGYDKPWLSFIPFANQYLLGKVADNINGIRGKRTSYAKVLLTLNILSTSLVVIGLIGFIPTILNFDSRPSFYHYYDNSFTDILTSVILPLLLLFIAGFGTAIAAMVVMFIALRVIFTDYDPKNASMYTTLSVVLTLFQVPIYAIFLFVIRKRMPISMFQYSLYPNTPPYGSYPGQTPPYRGSYGPPPPYHNQQVPPPPYSGAGPQVPPPYPPQQGPYGQTPPPYRAPQAAPPPQNIQPNPYNAPVQQTPPPVNGPDMSQPPEDHRPDGGPWQQ